MIARFNLIQIVKAVFCLIGGILCFTLAYIFFRYLPAWALSQVGFKVTTTRANGIAALFLVGVALGGYRRWKSGGGLNGFHESMLYVDFHQNPGAEIAAGETLLQVTGPAYVLGQVFLAAPLLLLRCGTLLASLIWPEPSLEERLHDCLDHLRAINKWQGLSEHPQRRQEILYLARMDKIDFSARKGEPRFKARRPDEEA